MNQPRSKLLTGAILGVFAFSTRQTLLAIDADERRMALAEEVFMMSLHAEQAEKLQDVWAELRPEMVRTYATTFTEQELREIRAFYISNAGRAFVSKGWPVSQQLEAQARELRARRTRTQGENTDLECLRRIGVVGKEVINYALDGNGTLPRTVEQLIGTYFRKDADLVNLLNPYAPKDNTGNYEIVVPAARFSELKPDAIVLRSKFVSPSGLRAIFRANGKTELIKDK